MMAFGCADGSPVGSSDSLRTTSTDAPQTAQNPESEQPQQPQQPEQPEQDPPAEPAEGPQVQLSAVDTQVNVGGSVELNWSSQDAASCNATGAWSGAKNASGSEVVGPISQSSTFTLSCENAAGSAVTMVSITAIGQLQLAWQAPEENVDGSPVDGIANYDVWYGTTSGQYDASQTVQGNQSSTTLALPVGSYYVAMTATDNDGNQSGYSNEVSLQSE